MESSENLFFRMKQVFVTNYDENQCFSDDHLGWNQMEVCSFMWDKYLRQTMMKISIFSGGHLG